MLPLYFLLGQKSTAKKPCKTRVLTGLLSPYVLVWYSIHIMKHAVKIKVYKDDGFYIAEGVDIALVTQGKTLDELIKNIQEAVELYLDGEEPEKIGIIANPSILVNFELPIPAHAQA